MKIKTIFLTLAAAALSAAARAQSESLVLTGRAFEADADAAIRPFMPEDAFAHVADCGVLDAKTLRPWSLDEARDLLGPCLAGVGRKYAAQLSAETGFLTPAQDGKPGKTGLLLKTDIVPGSKAGRDLVISLARRQNRLLGQDVRLLAHGDDAPASVSAAQDTLNHCLVVSVAREIKTGGDFVRFYGRCLTNDPRLKIQEIRPGSGLSVTLRTMQTSPEALDSLNGFVTVNAGMGPVKVMVLAYGAQVALP